MTATTWNAGIEAKKANPTMTAGEAWDAWIDSEEGIQTCWNYTTRELISAQMNFMHAFDLIAYSKTLQRWVTIPA